MLGKVQGYQVQGFHQRVWATFCNLSLWAILDCPTKYLCMFDWAITDWAITDYWLSHYWLLTWPLLITYWAITDRAITDYWLSHYWLLTRPLLITDWAITDWAITDYWLSHVAGTAVSQSVSPVTRWHLLYTSVIVSVTVSNILPLVTTMLHCLNTIKVL